MVPCSFLVLHLDCVTDLFCWYPLAHACNFPCKLSVVYQGGKGCICTRMRYWVAPKHVPLCRYCQPCGCWVCLTSSKPITAGRQQAGDRCPPCTPHQAKYFPASFTNFHTACSQPLSFGNMISTSLCFSPWIRNNNKQLFTTLLSWKGKPKSTTSKHDLAIYYGSRK